MRGAVWLVAELVRRCRWLCCHARACPSPTCSHLHTFDAKTVLASCLSTAAHPAALPLVPWQRAGEARPSPRQVCGALANMLWSPRLLNVLLLNTCTLCCHAGRLQVNAGAASVPLSSPLVHLPTLALPMPPALLQQCGGMLPWISWRLFLFGSATNPGNGGPLLQPRGQTSVLYRVPPPLVEQEQAQQPRQAAAGQAAQADADAERQASAAGTQQKEQQ